ncbi:MAG: T9SS type A sorting domain-containing protein, partial [Pseudarcicella sp.]|nr:T9SS type A sorting domain-containing protein [Pseudarcicella sp.]
TIFPRPTAQISGLKNVLLPDSVKIKIDFTGQKPFTFDLNNKIFTSNTEHFSYKVLEKLPQKYIYTISNFKDANCSNGFVAKDSVQIDVVGNALVNDLGFVNYPNNIGFINYPNPVKNQFRILFSNPALQPVTVQLFTGFGVKVLEENVFLLQKKMDIPLSVSLLPQGTYFIKLTVGDKVGIKKVLKN